MANGTIAFDTLSTSGQIESRTTGLSIDSDYLVHGTNKAWLRYGQASPSILKSLNISSVTDTSAGVYITIFTNGFDAAHYAISTSAQNATAAQTAQVTAATSAQVGGRSFSGTTLTDITVAQMFAGELA